MHSILTLATALILAGCMPFSGFVHDEVLDGPYRLVAVDTDGQMGLCLSAPGDSGDCFGDRLPGPRLIAAGADRKYVVMARRPADAVGDLVEPFVVEYYYIVRTPDEARGLPGKLAGPFAEAEFKAIKHKLGLPEFSRTFEELP